MTVKKWLSKLSLYVYNICNTDLDFFPFFILIYEEIEFSMGTGVQVGFTWMDRQRKREKSRMRPVPPCVVVPVKLHFNITFYEKS